jgi:hypothetical protein
MTAVEWLQEKYKQQGVIFNLQFEQAKEMEKEQIVTAHYQGYRNDIGTTEVSEQYYNETFNTKEK